MAWSTSNRRSQLPPYWDRIRAIVLKRDGYRCRWIREDTGKRCGAYATDVDHIDQANHDDHRPDALQSLCSYHHGRKSSSEGGTAAARKRAAKKRRHPGLLP